MKHAPAEMEQVGRIGRTHSAVVRGRERTRRHWIALMRCPVCGRESRPMENAVHGRDVMCTGRPG